MPVPNIELEVPEISTIRHLAQSQGRYSFWDRGFGFCQTHLERPPPLAPGSHPQRCWPTIVMIAPGGATRRRLGNGDGDALKLTCCTLSTGGRNGAYTWCGAVLPLLSFDAQFSWFRRQMVVVLCSLAFQFRLRLRFRVLWPSASGEHGACMRLDVATATVAPSPAASPCARVPAPESTREHTQITYTHTETRHKRAISRRQKQRQESSSRRKRKSSGHYNITTNC